MNLPFSAEQFFDVFRRYNESVWPAQWVLVVLALVAIACATRATPRNNRIVSSILASLWLWMAIAYHVAFFSSINPAAELFAVLFVLQGLMFLPFGQRTVALQFAPRADAASSLGALLLLYSLVVYPLLGMALGRQYPAAPTFGLPCPTTIFTLGLLLWTRPRPPLRLILIPLLWTAVGTIAALQLGVMEDFGLPAAGLVMVVGLLRRSSRDESKRLAPYDQRAVAVPRT